MKIVIPILLLFFVFNCGQQPRSYEVKPIDEAGFEQLISERNGKILVLNVWATWCLPCKEEFPALIQLAEKYRKHNVELVGLSVDYVDEIDTKIRPFLNLFPINFDIYVQNFKSDNNYFINRLNAEWNGALPATFIFAPNGEQLKFIEGKRSYASFEQELAKILNLQGKDRT